MKALAEQINELDGIEIYGRVVGVRGLMVEVSGPLHAMSVGARVVIETVAKNIPCEVVGFSGNNALLMPFAPVAAPAIRLSSTQSNPSPRRGRKRQADHERTRKSGDAVGAG